jgi:hypothetical protein
MPPFLPPAAILSTTVRRRSYNSELGGLAYYLDGAKQEQSYISEPTAIQLFVAAKLQASGEVPPVARKKGVEGVRQFGFIIAIQADLRLRLLILDLLSPWITRPIAYRIGTGAGISIGPFRLDSVLMEERTITSSYPTENYRGKNDGISFL